MATCHRFTNENPKQCQKNPKKNPKMKNRVAVNAVTTRHFNDGGDCDFTPSLLALVYVIMQMKDMQMTENGGTDHSSASSASSSLPASSTSLASIYVPIASSFDSFGKASRQQHQESCSIPENCTQRPLAVEAMVL